MYDPNLAAGRNGHCMVLILDLIQWLQTLSKMAAITKNRKLFNGPQQLYLKPALAQMLIIINEWVIVV